MFAVLMLFFTAAFAATYEVQTEIFIDKSTPTSDVRDVWNFGISDRNPAFSVDSSWSYMKCVSTEEGLLNLVFESDVSSWPTSWPSVVTCSLAHDGDTYKLTIDLTTCADSTCERPSLPSTVPNCSASNTITLLPNETRMTRCWLPAPPSGKHYVMPKDLHRGFNGEPFWYGQWRKGSSESEADPIVEALDCSIEWREVVATGAPKYLLTIWMSSTLPAQSNPYYCPIRLKNTSTHALSWGTPVRITLTRKQ